ncbi:MAG: hypothetical protein ACFFDN_11265 [Candidatus Hodarchaeota archaeon]
MNCEICGLEVKWNPEFWERVSERGIRDFKSLGKDVKASIIMDIKSRGIPLMLNFNGTQHQCRAAEDVESGNSENNEEFNVGKKINILLKGSEQPEEYIFLGICQFSDFTPKFLKLKQRNNRIYIQIAEIQKIYA